MKRGAYVLDVWCYALQQHDVYPSYVSRRTCLGHLLVQDVCRDMKGRDETQQNFYLPQSRRVTRLCRDQINCFFSAFTIDRHSSFSLLKPWL